MGLIKYPPSYHLERFTFDLQRFDDVEFGGGTGTADNPYLISTETQLRQLATYVNAGNNCQNLKFKLDNDITLTQGDWTAIGNNVNKFKGTFDGGGFNISGLNINSTADYQGLFGYVNGATISNINLAGVDTSGSDCVGAIVGFAYNSNISNCAATGSVSGNSNVGGSVGYAMSSTISNCITTGSVSGNDEYVGAVVGCNNGGTVKNNYYMGELADGVDSNSASQVYTFTATLPEDVMSDNVVTVNKNKYITAGEVIFKYNNLYYSYNVTGNVSEVKLESGKLYVDNNLVEAPFPYNLDTDKDGYLLIDNEKHLR